MSAFDLFCFLLITPLLIMALVQEFDTICASERRTTYLKRSKRDMRTCCVLTPRRRFTYGCEAWSLSKILEEKIEIFENWCLRMMGKIQWKDRISNEKVLQILKTKRSLLENIQKRKLKYFGHIKRKGNILTTAMEGRLCGRRSRGRPRNSWFTDIKTWTGLSGRECTRLAAQRDLWSVISRRPSSRR